MIKNADFETKLIIDFVADENLINSTIRVFIQSVRN